VRRDVQGGLSIRYFLFLAKSSTMSINISPSDSPDFLDDPLKEEKTNLRTQIRRARAGISAEEARIFSEQATEHLLAEPCIAEAKCVALYVSIRHEMATQSCIEALWKKGITTLVPRCDPVKAGYMDFVELRQWDELDTGRFGLLEAGSQMAAATQRPDVLIMPALAVDRQGHRLGQGGGYYDRFLMKNVGSLVAQKTEGLVAQKTGSLIQQGAWSDVPRIALVYSLQILETVPYVNHDYMVQAIAHEGGFVWV